MNNLKEGIFIGVIISTSIMSLAGVIACISTSKKWEGEAVKAKAAHYDAVDGSFKWNFQPELKEK